MDLVNDGDAVISQPLGDIHLPKRAVAIERSTGDLADQLIELPTSAWSGYTCAAQVIVQVDVVGLHPHRMMQLKRDVDELVAKRRQRHQPWICHFAKQVEGESA